MDAIIAAGGIPAPEDSLYALTQGKPKAFLEINGKPMLQWVLDAVNASKYVERIILVGLDDCSSFQSKLPVYCVPDQHSLMGNVKASMSKVREINPEAEYVLFISSDIPALRGEMIDWIVEQSMQEALDLYYFVIKQDVMERQFPTSHRTYFAFKDMRVCGADINIGRLTLIDKHEQILTQLTDRRKSAVSQAKIIGFDILFQFIFRVKTLDEMVEKVVRRFDLQGKGIPAPFAEIAMDVDKTHQFEILSEYLSS